MDKARQTCTEMFSQRGYEILEETEEQIIAAKQDDTQVMAFFFKGDKFNVKNIQSYIGVMNELGIYHAIVIYENGVTSFTKKVVEQSSEMEFELFSKDDLQYNITKHILQPEFEKLDPEESEEFKKKYGLKFAVLRKDDPIVKFYNYKRGDVIRVTRGKKEKYITYRIVKG